jgi:CubicO group peptidase (beta-lactamase class C family)
MVDSNGLLVAEGFGEANLADQRDMTVDTPLRVGSISKPVTAALALEVAADGLLDLDRPVDDYLDRDLSDSYGRASTVRQLLTHRGGYADAFLASHHVDPSEAVDLDRWVTELGGRVLPPGVVASYSTVGYTLAGAVIASAAGGEFADVAQRRLFDPLGMDGATFRQPAPVDVATGYEWVDGEYVPYPIDVPDLVPGAGLVASGRDMAAFMRSIVDASGPLDEATRMGMVMREGPEAGLRGYTLGLTEWRYGNRSVLYHEGNGIGTSNRLMILPDLGIGVFTAVNGEALVGLGDPSPQVGFVRDLHQQLVERFLSGSWTLEGATASGRAASEIDGTYVPSRIDTGSMLRLEGLVTQFGVVGDDSGATIGGHRYQRVGVGEFASGSQRIVFVDGPDGVYATRGGTGGYRQVTWWESMPVASGWLGGAIVLLLTGVALGARRSGSFVRWSMVGASGLVVAFVVSVGLGLANANVMELFTGIPAMLRAGQLAAAALVVLGVGLTIVGARSLHERPLRSTVGASMVAISSFAIAGWALVWGLLPM